MTLAVPRLYHEPACQDVTPCIAAMQRGLTAPPRLTVSDWADQYRILPSTAAEPGRWRTARTPYLKEIMECLSPQSDIETVVLAKGAQIGATEVGLNWLGQMMHLNPGLMLMVQPSLDMLKRNTTTRINPLIESTPALRDLVAEPRSRDGGNTLFRKSYPGGELVMTGANSAKGLRSTPARDLFLDEVDAYPGDVDEEGDPLDLAIQRTVTFMSRRKIYMCSTPTDHNSRIDKAYQETDQRRYFVPCQGCGYADYLRWEQVAWETDEQGAYRPETTSYKCAECGFKHQEYHKQRMLAQGAWKATATAQEPRLAGFHLSALYSPFESWASIVSHFLRVRKDPIRLKSWINTKLGEAWRPKGEAPEWERLYQLREDYPEGDIPQDGLVLTAGVDVQKDRLEVEVVAWGMRNQSWSVAHEVLEGDTASVSGDPWRQLETLLNTDWSHVTGATMRIRAMAVDEGYNTQTVRQWVRLQQPGEVRRRVIVVKGTATGASILGQPSKVDISYNGQRSRRSMVVYPVNTHQAKEQLYGWLRLNPPTDPGAPFPDGFCHFPQYSAEFFQQLTAEQLMTRTVKGYNRTEWVKTRERNEALDCRVYATAAAHFVNIHRKTFDHWWDEICTSIPEAYRDHYRPTRAEVVPASDAPEALLPESAPPPPPTPTRQKKKPRRIAQSSYLSRLR